MTCALKEGGFYRDSDGNKVGPLKAYRGLSSYGMAFIEVVNDGRGWTADGVGVDRSAGKNLVAEWTEEPDADGWIAWHGGECPVAPGTMVETRFRNPGIDSVWGDERPANCLHWQHVEADPSADIVSYRVAPDFAEVEGTEKPLSIACGKVYLDDRGFMYGPIDYDSITMAYKSGGLLWGDDGVCLSRDDLRLVSEWVPPVPAFAAEENERLRADIKTYSKMIDELKHDVEMHRDAASDAIADMRLAEGHLCRITTAIGMPETAVTREEQISFIKMMIPLPGQTAVFVPTSRLSEFSFAASDLACWMTGYCAALSSDDLVERAPMGRYVITELNIAMKNALDRVEKAS